MVRHSPPAVLCTCYHQKRQHARGNSLAWDGECHALNVTEVDGIREVKNCPCTKFEELQKINGKESTTA